ncbi:MAG: hypothetical protein AB1665_07175 [Candidatus Thermoplasmatota archaeon]
MHRHRKGCYSPGDQIHFVVTEDFVSTANEFAVYCEKNSINASKAMREAIANWLRARLEREGKLARIEQGIPSLKQWAERYEREVIREV